MDKWSPELRFLNISDCKGYKQINAYFMKIFWYRSISK